MAEPAATPAPSALTHVDALPDHHAFGALANLGIQVWWRGARGQDVRLLLAMGDDMLRQYPRGYSALHICKQSTGLPDASARQQFETILKRHGQQVALVAVVFEGSGFLVSALRAFITGVRMATSSTTPFQIYDSTPSALASLLTAHYQRTAVQLSHEDVDNALRYLHGLGEPP